MFWFDNSRKNLVSYARGLSSEERGRIAEIFTEIIGCEFTTETPILRFNSSDAKVINDYEIAFIKALYRASSDKIRCIQEINRCIEKDGLLFSEVDESIINRRGACAYIKFVDDLEGLKISKRAKKGEPPLRILREFQIMRSLNRLQIEKNESYIIECEEDQNGGYIMEVASDSLDQYISRIGGTPNPDDSIKIILRIIDCVSFLHSNKVLHRDLHPGNWLFVKGELKVSDFGLACYASDDRSGKGYKPSYGVPAYTANEQLDSLENTSEQSDIYTVGKLINFVLTKSPQKNRHFLHDISEKCTRTRPEERYTSIMELKQTVLEKLYKMNYSQKLYK